jgi:hypothetical protein
MSWSPACCTDCSSQSIHATQSRTIGEPSGEARQARPSNLSGSFDAKRRQTASWSAPRILTQKRPAERILGQLVELRSGRKATSGGSSDTEVKEPTAMPAGAPSGGEAVMTHTPVGYCPSTWRNQRELVGLRLSVSSRSTAWRPVGSGPVRISVGAGGVNVDVYSRLILGKRSGICQLWC